MSDKCFFFHLQLQNSVQLEIHLKILTAFLDSIKHFDISLILVSKNEKAISLNKCSRFVGYFGSWSRFWGGIKPIVSLFGEEWHMRKLSSTIWVCVDSRMMRPLIKPQWRLFTYSYTAPGGIPLLYYIICTRKKNQTMTFCYKGLLELILISK